MAEDGNRDHGDLAAQMAVAGGSEEARDYLRRQSRLTDLQIADLEREDHLRHWSLRVHHISDVMKLAFEFAIAIILLAIVALIAGAVWSAANDHGVVIEAFSVPPDMAAKGLTGEVVASKVLDRLAAMQAATDSTRTASSYSSNWGDNISVQIPDTGISVGELNKYLHAALGHETRITGEIYRTADGIAITARAGEVATPLFKGSEADAGALIDQAAASIYRSTQPYRYAIYLITHDAKATFGSWNADDTRAVAALQQLIAASTTEDRAWSYDGLGALLRDKGNFYGAAALTRKAIAVKPDLDFYFDLAVTEYFLRHDEASLKAFRDAVASSAHGEGSDLNPAQAATIPIFSRQIVAFALGDYLSALEYGRQLQALRDSGEYGGISLGYDLIACAALHDSACMRRTAAADSVDPHMRRTAAHVFADFNVTASARAAAYAGVAPVSKFDAAMAVRVPVPEDALIAAHFGDFAQAHEIIDKTPRDCDLCLRYHGRIDALEKNWDGAAYWFAIVAARSPSIPFADTDWGAMLLAKGDLNGAIAKFTLANQKGPHFADPLEMWGEALVHKNRSDLALAKFEEADKYAPNWGRLHLKWGEALFYAGQRDEAKKQFAIAATLDLAASEKSELARVMR